MFDNKKVLQIISYLLSLNGNKMDKLKLIKELYLIDRMSINEDNSSISGDDFFSMKYGPVLSMTLNIINDIPNDNSWSEYLKLEDNKSLILIKPFDEGMLSKRDKYFINAVSDKYKNYSTAQLIDFTHQLPEWKNPAESYRKIKFSDIMKALGKSDEEIISAKNEYDNLTDLYTSIGLK